MKYSEVLENILKRAGEIRREQGIQFVSAACIFMSAAELCNSEYRGITPYRNQYHPEWCEEERLRYVFRKMMKISPTLSGTFVRLRMKRDFAVCDYDFMAKWENDLNALMEKRGKQILSTDIVFLLVIRELEKITHFGLCPEYQRGFSVESILKDVDDNIYNYIIEEISKIQAKLQEKVEEAVKRRDWKPATKFIEPEEMLQKFYEAVNVKISKKSLELCLPYFFEGKRELRLTIITREGCYFVHDNGCTTGKERLEGEFVQGFTFLKYLQELVLKANEDITGCSVELPIVQVDWREGDDLDAERLLEELRKCVTVRYDEKKGLILVFGTTYSINETRPSFLIETLEDGRLRLSDNAKGKILGEILESFYWEHDDISHYTGYLKPYYERFGGECVGKDIYATVDGKGKDYVPAFFRFMNLAVLLSEFGALIEVPEESDL